MTATESEGQAGVAGVGANTATGGRSHDQAVLRAMVDEVLGPLFPLRGTDSRVRVIGVVDHDTIEVGRQFLRVMEPSRLLYANWPLDNGGLGLGELEAKIVRDSMERYEIPDLHAFLVGLYIVGPVLCAYATAEQQRRWLEPLRLGADIWCQLFSEPEAGSDLASLRTRATFEGQGWLINGQKVWSSRAHYAQRGLLLARSDSNVPKHAGITCFALSMQSNGVTVRPLRQMNGEAHFNEVFLDDVWVSDEDRIGPVGAGWTIALQALSHERGGRLDEIDLDQLRILLPSGDSPHDAVIRDRVIQSMIMLLVGGWAEERAATYHGPRAAAYGSLGKLRRSATVKYVAATATDALGLKAITGKESWQSFFLTSPGISIRGGTDEIQRNIVAERLLGLPPEPRVDKGIPFSARGGTP